MLLLQPIRKSCRGLAGAALPAGERGEDGEPEGGPRQREGAHVERRLRVDRGPARGGERQEREGDRETEAAGKGQEAHQPGFYGR